MALAFLLCPQSCWKTRLEKSRSVLLGPWSPSARGAVEPFSGAGSCWGVKRQWVGSSPAEGTWCLCCVVPERIRVSCMREHRDGMWQWSGVDRTYGELCLVGAAAGSPKDIYCQQVALREQIWRSSCAGELTLALWAWRGLLICSLHLWTQGRSSLAVQFSLGTHSWGEFPDLNVLWFILWSILGLHRVSSAWNENESCVWETCLLCVNHKQLLGLQHQVRYSLK